MKITISAHDHLEAFSANNLPAFARVYASQDFTNGDDESVGAGSIDSVNYVKEVACTYSAGVTTIHSFATTNRIDSTVLPENNGVLATYTLGLYSARGKRLAIIYAGLAIPETPTTTTWADIALYNQGIQQPTRHQYYDTNQINALLDGIDLAPKATDVIYGKSRLSYLQSTLLDPIAVGNNDPVVRSLRTTTYLDQYAYTQTGLNNFLAAIPTDVQIELKLTSQLPITSDTSIPSYVQITLEGNGSFTVATGHTLTINSMTPPTSKQVFFGLGNVVFGKNAVPEMNLSWWAGVTSSGDDRHAFAQLRLSLLNGCRNFYTGAGIWKTNEFDHVDSMTWRGAGQDIAATNGTVVELYDLTTASYVFGIKDGFRNVVVSGVTFSTGTSTVSNAIKFSGASPNSGIGAHLRDCTVSGTGTVSSKNFTTAPSTDRLTITGHGWSTGVSVMLSTTGTLPTGLTPGTRPYYVIVVNANTVKLANSYYNALNGVAVSITASTGTGTHTALAQGHGQLLIYDTSGGHGWECIGVHLDNFQWVTPVNGKSIHNDTVNASITLTNRQTNDAIGSTFWHGEYSGWLDDTLPDDRGVNASPDVTSAVERTIAGTIANGGVTLTLTTGQWTLDDMGQRTTIPGKLDANIIDLDNDGITATVDTPATSAATAAALSIYRYAPSAQKAFCVYHMINGRNEFTVGNWVDEGYQYSIINDGSDLSPFTVSGGRMQSRVMLNQAMTLTLTDGIYLNSQCIEGSAGITSRVNVDKGYLSNTSINGVVLTNPRLLGPQNGAVTFIAVENNASDGEYEQRYGVPALFKRGNEYNDALTGSYVVAIAGVDDPLNPDRPLIFEGKLNTITERPEHGHVRWRDNTTGWQRWVGTQAEPNNGFQLGGRLQSTTYIGGVVRPAQITSNQNNYFPGDSSESIHITTDASRNITGWAFTGTPRDGEHRIVRNVGTHNLVLASQNTSSLAAGRMLMDTGGNMTVLPNENVLMVYDLLAMGSGGSDGRWRVSKLNISALTSNGVAITASIPFASLDVTNTVTIGSFFAFTFSFTPTSGGTGLAQLGNLSGVHILIDENANLIQMAAAGIGITGDVGVTGSIVNNAAIRSTGTGGVGYAGGAGGTVTQITSRTTTVVLDKITGAIALFSAAGSATPFTFTVTNSTVAATDTIIVNQKSGTDVYGLYVSNVAAGSFKITVVDLTGTTTETPVINFSVLKGSAS